VNVSTQSFKNHAMFDPLWHFVLAPIALLLPIATIVHLFHPPSPFVVNIELVVVAFALLLAVVKERNFAIKVQDRVIRLEEQVRLYRLIPTETAVIDALSIDQLIGLRFASDIEVAALARRAVKENLDRKSIKAAVVSWRADEHRV
jgi:hypothetical protein